jgi:NAD(P)-dependent dehydrogenase (short-subunit alcohol dehydrogenase family)
MQQTQPTALITGAARRIGRAMALHLAKQGWNIGIHYHQSVDEAKSLLQEIENLGCRAFLIQADLSKEEQVRTIMPRAMEGLGSLDLLINNASIFVYDSVNTANRSSWNDHLEPNLRAPFVLMQDFAKVSQREGLIINMIDQRVWHLTPHFVSYTVSKFGLWGLTQSMALALAPRIRVNAIGPGPVLQNIRQTPEEFEAQCKSMPLGIGGSVDDICAAVDFFWQSTSVTGQMIAVDGGQHLGGAMVTKSSEK